MPNYLSNVVSLVLTHYQNSIVVLAEISIMVQGDNEAEEWVYQNTNLIIKKHLLFR